MSKQNGAAAMSQPNGQAATAKTILIVEDNDLNMKLFHALLETRGYNVLQARDGMEGLRLAREHHPDLIIMDCEGHEVTYLDPEKYPGVLKATIIVECHEWDVQPTNDILIKRFDATHLIHLSLSEAIRAPNNYECLRELPSHAKWMAISEGRPCLMNFLVMRPR